MFVTDREKLEEIVFENRNKEYGAYYLRRKYKKYVTTALTISLSVLIIAVGYPFILAQMEKDQKGFVEQTIVADLMDIKNQEEEEKPLEPPPPPPPALEQQVKFTAPIVVDSVEEKVELAIADEIVQTTTNQELTEETGGNEVIEEPKEEEEVVQFFIIEEKPEFPGGGEAAMLKFIADNTVYPPIAKENNIEGKVFVQFVIDKDGKVTNVQVMKGVDPYLDAEAKRVVQAMPKWIPGKQRGKPARVSFVIPIVFKLTN